MYGIDPSFGKRFQAIGFQTYKNRAYSPDRSVGEHAISRNEIIHVFRAVGPVLTAQANGLEGTGKFDS